ncbi:hypothetical protein ACQUJV_25415, partial [Ralstonia pseudosolanacearum]
DADEDESGHALHSVQNALTKGTFIAGRSVFSPIPNGMRPHSLLHRRCALKGCAHGPADSSVIETPPSMGCLTLAPTDVPRFCRSGAHRYHPPSTLADSVMACRLMDQQTFIH